MNKKTDQTIAVFHLMQDMGKVMRIFHSEAVLCEGVTFAQFCILDHVASHGGRLDLSELHDLLSVEKSTTTRIVNPLIKRGLIVREKSGHDSRAVELIITVSGKNIHKKAWLCISGFIEGVMQYIPGNQSKIILDSLEIFIRSIRRYCRENECGCE